MIIDWRGLLNAIRVPWKDRGANCRSGNVNIACPWCRDDPSYHLGIAEEREAYYCYRNPDQHSGRSFIGLLMRLGNSRTEAIRLLNGYMRHQVAVPEEIAPIERGKIGRGWNRFELADNSRPAMDYLRSRGFDDPERMAYRYDLRISPAGIWAGRLLLPFYSPAGELLSWTGRTWRPNASPRYLALVTHDTSLIYLPRPQGDNQRTLVLVEGPIDALKVAVAARGTDFLIAGLAGKQLNAAKLNWLRSISRSCDSILFALDADVALATRLRIISDIAGFLNLRYSGSAILPPGYKDPAEMALAGILPWLQTAQRAMIPRLE